MTTTAPSTVPMEASGKLAATLRSLGLFPPPNKSLGTRLIAMMAVSSRLHHRLWLGVPNAQNSDKNRSLAAMAMTNV